MNKELLYAHRELARYLYDKGFLITNANIGNWDEYPFFGNWIYVEKGNWTIAVHQRATLYTHEKEENVFFLIGHAYNPFTMDYKEDVILSNIACAYPGPDYLEIVNELTGVFILGVISPNGIKVLLDASGMQYACYGTVAGKQYITSHMRLLGDLCGLTTDDYVNQLIHYRWYHFMMGNYLPGDITCYKDVYRVIPNTIVTYEQDAFSVERFYPCHSIKMCETDEEYKSVIEEAAQIMRNTMQLIPQKWRRPAISLTGGVDSNTTFAAANGFYDKYSAFSYVSMPRELVDAEKAKEISEAFNVPFEQYNIPEENAAFSEYEIYKAILECNAGEIGSSKDNDIRKKVYLMEHDVCDVEVKSWISETIRAYAYKYYGRTKFPVKLKPRAFTSLYKIFLLKRDLVHKTDEYFAKYTSKTEFYAHMFNYDQTDFFVWEMMHGGKCGLNIGVMKSCFDITIPYNNRKLLDMLLRVPLDKRISDQHHMDLKKLMNKKLFDMNIRVVNLNETPARKRAINMYYIINTHLPF